MPPSPPFNTLSTGLTSSTKQNRLYVNSWQPSSSCSKLGPQHKLLWLQGRVMFKLLLLACSLKGGFQNIPTQSPLFPDLKHSGSVYFTCTSNIHLSKQWYSVYRGGGWLANSILLVKLRQMGIEGLKARDEPHTEWARVPISWPPRMLENVLCVYCLALSFCEHAGRMCIWLPGKYLSMYPCPWVQSHGAHTALWVLPSPSPH